MSRTIQIDEDVLDAIDRIVAYNWDDEKADFAEHEGDAETHIFTDLEAVNNWLRGMP